MDDLYGTNSDPSDSMPYGTTPEDLKRLKDLLAASNPQGMPTANSGIQVAPPTVQINSLPTSAPTPVDTSDDSEDDDSEDDNKVVAKATQKSNPQAPAQNNISSMIGKLLNNYGQPDDALASAQAQAQQNLNDVQMKRGAEQINDALTSRKHNKFDYSDVNDAEKNAENPVKDVLAQQDMQKNKLTQAETADKLQNEMQKSDASSPISQEYRNAVQKMTGQPISDKISAADLDKLSPMYEKMWQAQENAKNRAAMREVTQGQKSTTQQNQALQQTMGMLESARGNAEVQQAQKDIYAAKKANSLVGNLDPDNLSPQQVHLLVQEVSKIATGGVPAQAEVAAMMPETTRMKLASLWSKLQNSPEPAQAGAFVKQYQDYINKLSGDAHDVIKDKFGRVIESRKKQLGDDNYNTLKQQYLDPLDMPQNPTSSGSSGKQSKPQAGQIIKTKDGSRYQVGDDGETLTKL